MDLITDHLAIWTTAQAQKSTGRGKNASNLHIYGIKKLRDLILELAVRGKLVPQDPNDELASVLLKIIQEEKGRLLKKGKIRKQKLLPKISDKEKSFQLPEGWVWTRLGDVVEFVNGYAFKSVDFADIGVGVVKIGNIQNGAISTRSMSRVDENIVTELDELLRVGKGDMVIAMSGATTGKLGFNSTNEVFYLNQRVGKLVPICFLSKFLYYPLTTKIEENLAKSLGSAIPNLSTTQIKGIVIALPPLAEQHRIVAKVNELMTLCDQLEQQQTNSNATHQTLVETLLATLTHPTTDTDGPETNAIEIFFQHFDILFTTEQSIDQLKQTILKLAVMGKLVPQYIEDEPACKSLQRIADEKARLINAGQIRKQKPLPEISEAEKPFTLPQGWALSRLDDVMDITSGVTKGRKLASRTVVSIPYLRVANVQRGFLSLEQIKEIDIPEGEINKFTVIKRDLLITEGGDWDKVGRTAIWRGELPLIVHQNHIFKARRILNEQNENWLEKFLNSSFARDYFASSSKQTTNLASINKTQLRGCIVAIPPLTEQHRIVIKIDVFMAQCDDLKSRLSDAQKTQLQLADTIVDQVIV